MNNVKSVLKSIDSSNMQSIGDVIKIMAKLHVIADSPEPKTKEEIEDISAALTSTLEYAQIMLEKLSDYKDYVEKRSHANLGDVIADVELSIFNFASVIDAQTVFTIQWFANLLMSDEDKQQIAQTLVNSASKYTASYQELWKSIVANDPIIMESIRYPVSKGS